jgi:hypothetical protein
MTARFCPDIRPTPPGAQQPPAERRARRGRGGGVRLSDPPAGHGTTCRSRRVSVNAGRRTCRQSGTTGWPALSDPPITVRSADGRAGRVPAPVVPASAARRHNLAHNGTAGTAATPALPRRAGRDGWRQCHASRRNRVPPPAQRRCPRRPRRSRRRVGVAARAAWICGLPAPRGSDSGALSECCQIGQDRCEGDQRRCQTRGRGPLRRRPWRLSRPEWRLTAQVRAALSDRQHF